MKKKLQFPLVNLIGIGLVAVVLIYLVKAIRLQNQPEASLEPAILDGTATVPNSTAPPGPVAEVPAVVNGKYTIGQQVKIPIKLQNVNVRSTTSIKVVKGTLKGGQYAGEIIRGVNFDQSFGLSTPGYYALLSGIPGIGDGWVYAESLVKV